MIDISGNTFGRWRVVEMQRKDGLLRWLCECQCGTRKLMASETLRYKKSLSCGCWRGELHSIRKTTHGHTKQHKPSAEYRCWHGVRTRCLNQNSHEYSKYGARGIGICDRWNRFEAFLEDMGPRPSDSHSIDRIDNSRGYEPSNCRWATKKEQRANQRPRGQNRNASDILLWLHTRELTLPPASEQVSLIGELRAFITTKHRPTKHRKPVAGIARGFIGFRYKSRAWLKRSDKLVCGVPT